MKIPQVQAAYIGPPAHPVPTQISESIAAALSKLVEINEAYLPMVYVKGYIDPPAQVLVVVLDENAPCLGTKIAEALRAVLPLDFDLDISELHPNDSQRPTIRATGTQLHLDRRRM